MTNYSGFNAFLLILAILLLIGSYRSNAEYEEIQEAHAREVNRKDAIIQEKEQQLQVQQETMDVYYKKIMELRYRNDMLIDTFVRDDEREIFARLVQAEAQGEGFEGRLAVANVVLNRVRSKGFPDTIRGVIEQDGQFCPVRTGAIDSVEVDSITTAVVDDAIRGEEAVPGDALFFYNPAIVSRGHSIRNREVVQEIGNHVFAR